MTRYRGSVPLTEDWQHFRFEVVDGVATVTLNRPEKMNPLTFESYADLRDLLHELPHRDDAKVLVIRGEGKGFCGGGDVNEIIGELIKMDPKDLIGFTRMTGEVIRAMRECPVPIVAGIQGIAAGAGSVIALASDFRVCTTRAKFAFLFTKVGLSGGDMGAAYLLPRHGRRRPRHRAAHARRHHRRGDRRPLRTREPAGRRGRPRRRGRRPRPTSRRRADAGVRADEVADHPRAGHADRLGDGAGRDDPGAADDHARPCRVPRRLQREAAPGMDRGR